MEFNLTNIVESATTLAIFYVFYKRFLKKETFHKMNRIYLLTTLLFAVSIPFFSFTLNFDSAGFLRTATDENFLHKMSDLKSGYIQLNEVVIYASRKTFSWQLISEILKMIYFLGVGISALFFIAGLIRIVFLVNRGKSVKYGDYRLVYTQNSIVPFSIFKWIIINPEKYSSGDIKQVIAHEKMHAFQLHSLDLILIEVLVILFWFNPFIYWYRKSIREIHEYLADEAVLDDGFDKINYQQLLFKQASDNRFIGLTSSFSYSLSKNRLKMLTMMKSKNISKIKVALAIPFAALFIFFFTNSCDFMNEPEVGQEELVSTEEAKEVIQDEYKVTDEEIHFSVDSMPKFEGKPSDEFRFFIQENLKYPEEAQKKKIEGRVFVQFDIDKEGYMRDVKIIRGVDPILDEEAVRVTELSPRWEPGIKNGESVRVRFTFPIIFRLSEE